MSQIAVRPVLTTADRDRFIRLQWTMNERLPGWVPPLLLDRRLLMDRKKNPFYLHSEAGFFIAERGGEAVGRIGAILNNNHNREHNEKIGFFGFFECVDEPAVARALFDAAEGWMRERGLTASRGPANPSVNDEYGLLVEGFDLAPAIMMPYNPPYYTALIEGAGYRKAKDLYAYSLHQDSFVSDKLERVTALLRERSGMTIRPIDMKRFREEVELIRRLYADAWQHNWGAVPLTREEFDLVAKSMRPILEPGLVLIAEAGGEPVGFGLSLPDYNQVLRHNRRGWLVPGLLRMFLRKKKIDRVRILVLGVRPDRLRTGAGSLLMYETGKRANALGYPWGEASWVLEDNVMMNRAAEFMNAVRAKTYRIYDKPL